MRAYNRRHNIPSNISNKASSYNKDGLLSVHAEVVHGIDNA
jgi:hypothetical protein